MENVQAGFQPVRPGFELHCIVTESDNTKQHNIELHNAQSRHIITEHQRIHCMRRVVYVYTPFLTGQLSCIC